MQSTDEEIYDPEFVKKLFDRCSEKYILFSYVCSLGFTERWRRECAELLEFEQGRVQQGYDLMAGTGEIWPHLLKVHPSISSITAVDISSGMHKRALNRLHKERARKVAFIEDNVLNSQLEDVSADFVVSTFGLKTFNQRQQEELAQLISRILKPGGQFALIEASDPKGWFLRPLYLFYLKTGLPLVERLFLRGAQDFAMIGKYATSFSDAHFIEGKLKANGLETRFKRHFFGCATSVSGFKPTL